MTVFVLSLIAVCVGAISFGLWMGSAWAGVWMLVVLLWAEGASDNIRRRNSH